MQHYNKKGDKERKPYRNTTTKEARNRKTQGNQMKGNYRKQNKTKHKAVN